METGFGLRQIDQILRHAFLLERPANHLVVSAGTGQRALEGAASAIGEVVDIARDLVGHHQRQVGVRGLDFGFGLGFYILIDSRGSFVGFVDRSAGSDGCSENPSPC